MNLSKSLIMLGSIVLFVGLFMYAYENLPLFGKLKGDVMIKKGKFIIYLPFVTFFLLSICVNLIINLSRR